MSQTDTPRERRDHGPELPEVKMHLHPPADPGVGVVVENKRCTARKSASFVRHVAIDVSKTSLAGNFRAGQSFGVIPPGQDERGRPHKLRLYSIASPSKGEDGQGHVLATTVKRTIDEHWETGKLFLGVASNYLADLQPGDEIRVTGPSGKRFLTPAHPEDHDYIFFATGTGIAPFRGMIHDLLDAGAQSRVTLVMGAAYATDLLYHADLLRLEQEHENFTYLTAISRETQGDGHDPLYVQDRLRTHQDHFLPQLETDRALIYVCGIAGMELGIFQQLARLLPPSRLDRFLRCDSKALSQVEHWERRMIHKEVAPTRRVFLEVY